MNILRTRSLWTVLLCVFGVLAISATSGLAQSPPVREVLPFPDDLVIPDINEPGGVCSFPVRIHFEKFGGFNQYFFDKNGDLAMIMFEGHAVIDITNVETMQSVVRNISGPGSLDPATSIQTMSGPWFFWFPPDDPFYPSSLAGLYIHTGSFVVDFGGPVAQVLVEKGSREDLCVTLSSH